MALVPGKNRHRRRNAVPRNNPAPLNLHPHQEKAVAACISAFNEDKDRIAVCSPTGSGKTIMMMSIIDRMWKVLDDGLKDSDGKLGQVLILVPSIQIATQTVAAATKAFKQLGRTCKVDLEQGDRYCNEQDTDVVVATWQSLHRSYDRLVRFEPQYVELIIVDEAHHAASPCFLKILHYFNSEVTLLDEGGPPIAPIGHRHRTRLLGFSATLDRTDGFFVEDALPHRVYHGRAEPLIDLGTLSQMKYVALNGGLDEDYLDQLQDCSDDDDNIPDERDEEHFREANQAIIKQLTTRPEMQGRSFTLVFCKRIKQVVSLHLALLWENIKSGYVTCNLSKLGRMATLRDFRARKFGVLINCGVLVEGADLPHVDCLMIARPTQSAILMTQMIGRGLRTSAETNKVDCLVMDLTSSLPAVAPEVYSWMRDITGQRRDCVREDVQVEVLDDEYEDEDELRLEIPIHNRRRIVYDDEEGD